MTKLGYKDINRKWKFCEQLRIVACVNDAKERPREWPIVDLSNHELLKRSTHGPKRGLIAVVRRRQSTALSKSTKIYACTDFSQISLSFLLCVVIVDTRVTQLGSPFTANRKNPVMVQWVFRALRDALPLGSAWCRRQEGCRHWYTASCGCAIDTRYGIRASSASYRETSQTICSPTLVN